MGIKFYKAGNSYCSGRGIIQSGRILAVLAFIILGSISGFSQTTSLSFSQIATSTDIISPGRGAQQWNGSPWDNSNDPYIPSNNTVPQEWYSRFLWAADLETGAQGVYTFSVFDSRINAAIDAGQLFSFGVMPMCSGCIAGQITYPAYLHTLMQAEATNSQDWFSNVNGSWIPNWNSPNYIARWTALMNALAAHIAAGSHNGVAYKNAIGYVDIRGYGETGEWNTYPWYGTEPSGRKATDASLRAIIDAVANAFPNNQLVICFGSLDPGNACLTPAATSSYVLSRTNNYGHIGWRRDNLGDPGFDGAEDGNAGILTQWQVAPIGGEPNNDASDVPYGDLPREVTKYHMSYFGNGNWASVNASNATFVANARQASLNSGYRLTLNGGSTTTNAALGSAFNITLNWRNIGVAPVYRNYKTQFELRTSSGTVVWTGNSSFHSRLFLPAGSDNVVTDTYTLNGFAAGTYSLYLILRDSLGYTMPLPLSITGRNSDGSYLLRSNIVVSAGSANQPPVANAGSNQTITLPTSTVSLTGSGTDASGTITTYAWTKSSGPAGSTISSPGSANTNVTGLVQGVYVYKLLLTDNLGDTGSATVQITVNPAVVNLPPVANAGSNQTITLPTSTVSLTGSGTDASGTITTYAWTKSSGPAGSTISSPGSANTNVTGLVQGVYVYKLLLTDNLGDTGSATVQITVNPAVVNQPPVANAGSNQTITLPASSISLSGSGTDASGTISSYAWTKSSGPTGSIMSSPAAANTNVTGLVQGVYVFKLTIKDNLGDTGTATVQITVNPAVVNQPPVANAGPNQTIQLPTSTVSLTGSGTDVDGTVVSYAWAEISGPSSDAITSPSTASTSVTGLVQGVYKYQLKVTDNLGAIGLDTVQITVNPAVVNQPPVANAGSNQTITLPTSTVSLTGSGTDASGTITTYAWTKSSGPAGSTISNPGSANTNVTGLVQGVYVYKLLLTDNLGDTGSATVQITVNPAVVNQPPIANAGPDQTITLPTNSVTISGSASSDPDGTISSYQWTKISGPAQFNIVNSTSANTIVNNLTAGSYSFQLKVTDNGGAIAMDTIKIIVNSAPANQPPVANAGANISITLPTNVANLNGSASTDPDGTISAYAWTQVSGPSTATISAATSANTNISGLVQGSYVFALKVTDNGGATNADSVTVTVNPAPNIPPVANAGTSKTITLPTNSTNLDGSLSSDPDGSIVSYAWVQISGPSTSTILGGTLSVATATNLVAGVYTFQLTVTDNSGASTKANVKITVNSPGAQPPVANAGADQTITLPINSVTIDGSGSSASSGSIVSYVWTEKSGPSTVSLSNTAKNTLSNLQAGVYVFGLTVTDNNNATGTDSVIITVNPAANIPPVANPGSSISLTLPTNSTTLNGSNSYDPDGTISSYSWTKVSGPNTPSASGANTATLSLSGLIAGQYSYRLTVTDNSGASSSALVNIIVAPAANIPPVANAGANQSITAPANSVILNGSSSYDPDGTITAYNWVTVSGPGSITINNSNTATPSVVGLQPGVYTFQLTVTDNNGATATDQVFVTVLPQVVLPNQAPVANAGSNLTITLPDNTASLNGTSSFDPDGTISDYAWSQVSGPSAAVITGANTSTPTVSQLVVGQYVYQLTVTDNNGATNSDQVTITVNAGIAKVDQPPVANAGPSDTISMPNNTYMLDASQSTDPDGTITSYQWQEIGGPNTVTSSSMNGAQVSVSGLTEGQYEFQVTVTDNTGATATATMNLTVEPGLTSTDKLSVFPNPASNHIHEKITSSVTGTVKISVYDMNGRLVLSKQIDKSSETIYETMNVSSLASGMYTIQINIANQKTMVTKFIKD